MLEHVINAAEPHVLDATLAVWHDIQTHMLGTVMEVVGEDKLSVTSTAQSDQKYTARVGRQRNPGFSRSGLYA